MFLMKISLDYNFIKVDLVSLALGERLCLLFSDGSSQLV